MIPKEVHAAARRLRQGGLKGEFIEEQPPILRFLEVLGESGEAAAMAKLERQLRNYPMFLGHPYWWGIIERLWSNWFLPEGAEEWLRRLAKAWVEGLTLGWTVSITNSGGGRGRRASLFPHLRDRDGWLPTVEAAQDQRDAVHFRRVYDELMANLENCFDWRVELRYFRIKGQMDKAAAAIREVFEALTQGRSEAATPLTKARPRLSLPPVLIRSH